MGLLNLCVTTGGLLFVWRQLKATEVSADAARRATVAAVASTRPWIQVDVDARVEPDDETGAPEIHISCVAKNVGSTPAVYVEVRARISGDPDFLTLLSRLKNEASNGVTLFPGQATREEIVIPLPEDAVGQNTVFVIAATYRSGGDGDVHMTPEIYVVMSSSTATWSWPAWERCSPRLRLPQRLGNSCGQSGCPCWFVTMKCQQRPFTIGPGTALQTGGALP